MLRSGLGWGVQRDPGSGLKIEAPDLDSAGGGRWGFLFARAGRVAASAGAHEVKQRQGSERANLTTKEASKEPLRAASTDILRGRDFSSNEFSQNNSIYDLKTNLVPLYYCCLYTSLLTGSVVFNLNNLH